MFDSLLLPSEVDDDLEVWESMVDISDDQCVPETLGERLEQLAQERPGWAAVAELASLSPELLSSDDAVTYLQVASRAAAWIESLSQRALVAAAGAREQVLCVPAAAGRPAVLVSDPAREEIAAALGLAPSTAQSRIDTARVLRRLLPATEQALAEGRITALHARVIAETLTGGGLGIVVDPDDLDVALAAEFEVRVLPTAEHSPVGQTRTRARRVFRALDPSSGRARVRRARAGRDVQVRHEPDGVSLLTARIGTEDAHRIATAVDALARDEAFAESLDDPDAHLVRVRRAAALAALVSSGRAATGAAAGEVEMHLLVDLPTLTGLRDAPVEVLEGGVVPADVARRLALDARFRRLVADPNTGHLLDLGRRSYAIPGALRAFWWPATAPAATPDARVRPAAASSTTLWRGTTAAPRRRTTSSTCAYGITSSRRTADGRWSPPTTAAANGPPRSGEPTAPIRRLRSRRCRCAPRHHRPWSHPSDARFPGSGAGTHMRRWPPPRRTTATAMPGAGFSPCAWPPRR